MNIGKGYSMKMCVKAIFGLVGTMALASPAMAQDESRESERCTG